MIGPNSPLHTIQVLNSPFALRQIFRVARHAFSYIFICKPCGSGPRNALTYKVAAFRATTISLMRNGASFIIRVISSSVRNIQCQPFRCIFSFSFIFSKEKNDLKKEALPL